MTARLERLEVEGVDPSVAEVADQQVAAEPAELCWCEREPPGRVERTAGRHAGEKRPRGIEHAHDAEAGAGHLLFRLLVLLAIGHKDAAVDVLDAERRVPARKLWVDKRGV